jgi:hypothetical protein
MKLPLTFSVSRALTSTDRDLALSSLSPSTSRVRPIRRLSSCSRITYPNRVSSISSPTSLRQLLPSRDILPLSVRRYAAKHPPGQGSGNMPFNLKLGPQHEKGEALKEYVSHLPPPFANNQLPFR